MDEKVREIIEDIEEKAEEISSHIVKVIEPLLSKIKELESLIIHQTDYIKLLTDELDEVCVLASTHGWKSTRYEEGKRLRKLIEKENNENVSK